MHIFAHWAENWFLLSAQISLKLPLGGSNFIWFWSNINVLFTCIQYSRPTANDLTYSLVHCSSREQLHNFFVLCSRWCVVSCGTNYARTIELRSDSSYFEEKPQVSVSGMHCLSNTSPVFQAPDRALQNNSLENNSINCLQIQRTRSDDSNFNWSDIRQHSPDFSHNILTSSFFVSLVTICRTPSSFFHSMYFTEFVKQTF